MITCKRDLARQLFILNRYVFRRLKRKDLSCSQRAKPVSHCRILFKKRKILVNQLKSKTFYDLLLIKVNTKPNMKSIWKNKFDLNPLYWPKLISQKLSEIEDLKLREFNFKLIHNLIPSGQYLVK